VIALSRVARLLCAALLALSCTRGSSPRSVDAGLMCDSLPDTDSGGGRKSGQIKSKVREHLDAFEACYQSALRRDPKAAGRVETRFVIDADGSVSSACIHKTTLEDGEAVECMLDEFRNVRFGAAKGTVTVVYPLSYSPG
jgi:hypothetical protein